MLYPIFNQKRVRSGDVGPHLEVALDWWLDVLSTNMSETRAWQTNTTRPVNLLCDARSTPPRVAAVLAIEGKYYYSDMAPPAKV